MKSLDLLPPVGVLEKIVARTLEDVAARREAEPMALIMRRLTNQTRDLHAALKADGLGLIAEIKPRSPSRGDLRPSVVPEEMAAIYQPYAAAISVLCDTPFFGGSHALLARARAACDVPVLCKDFIVTEYQLIEARDHGADAVLLMASLLADSALARLLGITHDMNMSALVEVHDAHELARVLDSPARIIGVNSRDLRTLQIDLDGALSLLAQIPEDRIKVAESGIATRAQVERVSNTADAALIGSALMAAPDPAAAIEALGWTPCR